MEGTGRFANVRERVREKLSSDDSEVTMCEEGVSAIYNHLRRTHTRSESYGDDSSDEQEGCSPEELEYDLHTIYGEVADTLGLEPDILPS